MRRQADPPPPPPPRTAREHLDLWEATVQAQLEASRKVDADALVKATHARQAIEAELEARVMGEMTADDQAHGAQVAARIRALDARIRCCGAAVLGVVDRVLPDAGPGTYNRQGHLRGP